MARVRYVPISEIDPSHRDLLARPINLGLALVANSEGYRNHHMLGAWIRGESRLDARLRELIILQVGLAAHSAYEFSHHVRLSRSEGVTAEDVTALIDRWQGRADQFTPVERAALDAATLLTRNGDIPDALWAELAGGLDAELLIELVLVIGYYNHVTRVLSALRIDVEPEYLPYLAQFPVERPGEEI
jgi:alkylhydroperoxidase family enzyme